MNPMDPWFPKVATAVSVVFLAGFGTFLLTSELEPVQRYAFVDFFDYYFAGDAVLNGADPYDATRSEAMAKAADVPVIHRSPFIYPAWCAIAMVPMSLVPPWAAAGTWFGLSALLLIGTLRDATPKLGLPGYAWPLALLFPPVLFTLFVGQVNALLLSLLWIAWSRREKKPVVAGLALGLAIGIKLNPLLLFVPLLAARRFRVVTVATMTGLACLAIGELVLGGSTWTFASRVLPGIAALDPIHAHPVNQGLKGFFLRLFVENPWTQPIANSTSMTRAALIISWALLGVVLVATAVKGRRRREDGAWAFAIGLMIAASPLAWESLYAMALLPMALLWRAGHRLPLVAVWSTSFIQRVLDDFANHPHAHPVLASIPPLSSIALAGIMTLMVIAALSIFRRPPETDR